MLPATVVATPCDNLRMTQSSSSYLVDLHGSLDQRLRPEDVLKLIVGGCPDAVSTNVSRRVQEMVNRPQYWHSWSSMSSDFASPVGGARQLASAALAFQREAPRSDPDEPEGLRRAAVGLGAGLGWSLAHEGHLTREQRAAAGVELSRRKYNRQWRAVQRIKRKADRLEIEQRKRELFIIGRSGLAHRITLERFAADPAAAHFIAYWIARKNQRRQFSLSGKENPMDEIAQELLSRCQSAPATDWAMIALVRPTPDVLGRLPDVERGYLLGQWAAIMREAATILKMAWSPDINRTAMVVRRGNDSSTWNTIAQAYNTARASWLSCISAVRAETLLDASCPGKAMRLMAADLVRWHIGTGGALEPNTAVWASLPLPWDVLDGKAISTRDDVEAACQAAGLDPQESGWTAPRSSGQIAQFRPTPELVHGVSIADPVWAGLLRRAGVFSGKKLANDAGLVDAALSGLSKGVVSSDLPSRLDAAGWLGEE